MCTWQEYELQSRTTHQCFRYPARHMIFEFEKSADLHCHVHVSWTSTSRFILYIRVYNVWCLRVPRNCCLLSPFFVACFCAYLFLFTASRNKTAAASGMLSVPSPNARCRGKTFARLAHNVSQWLVARDSALFPLSLPRAAASGCGSNN